MTSSERFSLDKDWDKLNIKTIFRKKSTNAIGLELQITELISGMLSYNWWVCCVTMFQVRVSLARETRRPIQPWERNLNHPNKNALRATASGKWFNILKQSRNRSESGVSVFLCVTWTPLIFTCFDACGVPIYNAWNTQMKSRNGNLQRNKTWLRDTWSPYASLPEICSLNGFVYQAVRRWNSPRSTMDIFRKVVSCSVGADSSFRVGSALWSGNLVAVSDIQNCCFCLQEQERTKLRSLT